MRAATTESVQSLPKPRGGMIASISVRSRSQIASSASASGLSRRFSGRLSSQAAYSPCARRDDRGARRLPPRRRGPTTQWSASSTGPTPKASWHNYAPAWRNSPWSTFDFLGFTPICSRSRQGRFLLARHTRRDRKMAKLLEISEELRRRWHQDVAEQGAWLGSVVRGYFAYHAVPTNTRALSAFRRHVVDIWRRALRRRSHKDRTTLAMVDKLADRWPPKPRISHPWPAERFRVRHPRWEPYAGIPPVRFCAVGAR